MESVQMTPIKVLFVCNFNMMRSATAEMIFKDDPVLEVKSAGISPEAIVVIDEQLVGCADIIFVMELMQRQFIEQKFPDGSSGKKIISLGIGDHYQFMDEKLIEVLKSGVEAHLKKIFNEAPPSDPDSRCW
jgi:predicted protein tyrosine phosphatase